MFVEKWTKEEADVVTGKPSYYLRIFPETTLEDVSSVWAEVNKFINGKKIKIKRQKLTKTHTRDRKIYMLAKDGARVEEIAKYFQHWHKEDLDYGLIHTALNRYQAKMGIKGKAKLSYIKDGKPASLIPFWKD